MAKTNKITDLTKIEGDPTAHAYVDLPQEDEDFKFKAWTRASGVSIKTRTRPWSLLSMAIATFLLTASGCACTATLARVGAPTWATISGLLVPAAILFSLEQCLRPVDRPGWVYLPGDRLESQAMTGVGAPAGKVQPDAHRSPWRRLRPRGREGQLVADR
jgi:hypothetical protein